MRKKTLKILRFYFKNGPILLYLDQGWPTQIGLWVALGKNSKKIDYLGQNCGKTPKISKNHRGLAYQVCRLPDQSFPLGSISSLRCPAGDFVFI